MVTTDMTKYAENEEQMPLAQLLSNASIMHRFEMAAGREAGSVMINIFNAAAQNPEIWKCEPMTVVNAALTAATMKLSLSTSLGQACILPFNKSTKVGDGWKTEKRAQLIVMFRGVKEFAMRTNKYRVLNAFPVYEGQTWVEDQMTGIGHPEGNMTKKDAIGYGAYLELFSGYKATVYMTVEEVTEHAKKFSPTFDKQKGKFSDKSRWVTNFDEQARKTVLKRLIMNKGVISESDRSALEQLDTEQKDAGPEWPQDDDTVEGNIVAENKMLEKEAAAEDESPMSEEEAAYLAAKEVKTPGGALVYKLEPALFKTLLDDKFAKQEAGKAARAIDAYRKIKAAEVEKINKELGFN